MRELKENARALAVVLGNPDLRVIVKPSAEPGYLCAAYAMTLRVINVRIFRDEHVICMHIYASAGILNHGSPDLFSDYRAYLPPFSRESDR
jgi:hypothetical protein